VSIHRARLGTDLIMWMVNDTFEVDGIIYEPDMRTNYPRLLFEQRPDDGDHYCGDGCDEALGLYDFRDESCKKSGLPSLERSTVYRWRPGDPVYGGAR
jgi:hypothetical protein